MTNYLDEIIKRKESEIALIRPRRSLKQALRQDKMVLIAEIKRQSPSRGLIRAVDDPVALARRYCQGGAAALSILTDQAFGGSLQDLRHIASILPEIPLLRKDFLIAPVQIQESLQHGASAVLLIVAILGSKTKRMLEEAKRLGLDALVEVHDAHELKLALDSGADIIGINNRNLQTFEVDLNLSRLLGPQIPGSIIKVAESGICSRSDVEGMREAGFDAVLIGEALMKVESPEILIEEWFHDH
ncbi:MAG: indole-3-glycerol phosphate synthase TrpC [Parachlamydia sp.]|nr:indole-3-glycerol phosphate synthase TrpC [Parachlamydia sp.]